VKLPSPREEARSALRLGRWSTAIFVGVITFGGTAATVAGAPEPNVRGTLLFFGGAALVLWLPFVTVGLLREVRMFTKVRAFLGEDVDVLASGELRSIDGRRRFRAPQRGVAMFEVRDEQSWNAVDA
jgi:hypothetical protein